MKGKLMIAILAATFCGASFAGTVNVNAADAKTISKELVGVGDTTASRIVEERSAHGPFKSADDLAKRVKGVGKKTLEKNQANLKFGG